MEYTGVLSMAVLFGALVMICVPFLGIVVIVFCSCALLRGHSMVILVSGGVWWFSFLWALLWCFRF